MRFNLIIALIIFISFVESRQVPPIKKKHDSFGCDLNINRDLPDPQPLFMKPGQNISILPDNHDGIVHLVNGQELELFCTEGLAVNSQSKSAKVQCSKNDYMKMNNKEYKIHDLKCHKTSRPITKEVGKCYQNAILIEIGYKIQDNRFLKLFEVCFDKMRERPLYTHAKLTKANAAHQKNVDRGGWVAGKGYFSNSNANKLYSVANQFERMKKLVGASKGKIYVNKKINLARGHLAPMVDFVYGVHQRATMHLLNAAPQWNTINGGNWFKIEESVRDLVENGNSDELDVYTGTFDVLNVEKKPFYLASNSNDDGVMPVPKIFYKVVIDARSGKGVALIMTNNPFLKENDLDRYIYCNDVAKSIKWVRKMKQDLSKGYFYACQVEDFAKVVKHLPSELKVQVEQTGAMTRFIIVFTFISAIFIITNAFSIKFGNLWKETQENVVSRVRASPMATGCEIDIKEEVKEAEPLILIPDKNEFLLPSDASGRILLKPSDTIELACTEGFKDNSSINFRKVTCVDGTKFMENNMQVDFKTLKCVKDSIHVANRISDKKCFNNATIINIGFDIQKRFFKVYEICFDEVLERTHYVTHEFTPGYKWFQNPRPDVKFISTGFFNNTDVDKLYTRNVQRTTIAKILESEKYANFYVQNDTDFFLARGHLAARSDFVFINNQRASFWFMNAAPQWQVFNNGNWRFIEEGIRDFVAEYNLEVDVFTGTYGTTTLLDENNKEHQIYLRFDENNNGLIPVPKLYYKILVDRKSQKGIVLIGVNNPYLYWLDLLKGYVLCPDVSHKVKWLSNFEWQKNNLTLGYSYACDVNEFRKVVKHHPDLNVTGLLSKGETPVKSVLLVFSMLLLTKLIKFSNL
uniref:CSON006568 protein n=1 Tax=Culicoides sonorensis TaxID=179676 RepID=A0A336MTT0_CULSO